MFVAFLVGVLACVAFATEEGDPMRIMAPYDYNKQFCGLDGAEDYPNLLFTKFDPPRSNNNPIKFLFDNAVCVKTCPENIGDTLECFNNDRKCRPTALQATIDVINFCVPIDLDASQNATFTDAFQTMLDNNVFGQQIISLYNCSTALAISLCTAIVLSLAYIYLLSAFGEILSWIVICLIGFGLSAGTGMSLINLIDIRNGDAVGSEKEVGAVFGVFFTLTLCFILLVWCGFNQLKTAIDCVDAGADFLAGTKRLIGLSFLYGIISFLFVLGFIGALLCVLSMGLITPEPNTDAGVYIPQARTFDVDDGEEELTLYMSLFLIFSLLWMVNFLSYQTGLITMISASTYYFNSNASVEGEAEVGYAIWAT